MKVYTLKQPFVFAMQFDCIDSYRKIVDELTLSHGFFSIHQEGDQFNPVIRLGNQEIERGVVGSKYVALGDYILSTSVQKQFDVMPYKDFEQLYTPFFE